MIVLIAESKTMTSCDLPVRDNSRLPEGENVAAEIMARVASMTVPQFAELARFSPTMAAKAITLAYEFPNKTIGQKAMEAFTGVVFKSLDYPSLPNEDRRYIDHHVRLLSSLYGYLKPTDIIKAYRLDYTTPLVPEGKSLAQYWKKDATIALIRELKERPGESILNLLPGDAAKMIDWKLVKHFAPVWKVDFKELRDSSVLERLPAGLLEDLQEDSFNPGNISPEVFKTPNSTLLKELRGHLIREIALRNLNTPGELMTFRTDRLLPLGTPDYPDHIAFFV